MNIHDCISEMLILKDSVAQLLDVLPTLDPDTHNKEESLALYDAAVDLRRISKQYADAVEDEFMFFFLQSRPNGIYRECGTGLKLKKKKIYSVRDDQRTVESLIQFAGGSFDYLSRGERGAFSANPWKISVIRSVCGDDHLSMLEEENVSICLVKPKPEGV